MSKQPTLLKKSLRALLTVACLAALCTSAYGQNQMTVKGVVLGEAKEPLSGAAIMVAGSPRGISTSEKGEFSINVSAGDSLKVTYLGMEDQYVKVGPATTLLTVIMRPSKATQIEETVVVAYGSVRKSDLTGAVTSVRMSEIESSPLMSVDQALQGKIAGADMLSTSGEPGASTSIRIRGTRSITADNEPLIVVDGVMEGVRDLSDLNSADIESISVLKDASATALYGARAANGVIIVTTKKGSSIKNKPNITLKADAGFSYLPALLDVMDATEFGRYYNDYAYFSTSSNFAHIVDGTPMAQYRFPDPYSLGKGTNWVDEITRTAPYQNYNLSVSGSNSGNSYYAAIGYNDTQGIIQQSGQTRWTARLNLDYKLLKWLKASFRGSYTERDQAMTLAEIGGTAYYQAAQYLSPLITPDSDFNPLWGNGQKINTPRALIDMNDHSVKRIFNNYSLALDIQLMKNLKFRTQGSHNTFQRHEYRYYPSTLPRKAEGEGGEAYRAEYDETKMLWENMLTYDFKSKSGHTLDAMVGFTVNQSQTNNMSISGKGYLDDRLKWNNLTAVVDKENYNVTSAKTKALTESFMGRINYNYRQKYYVTLTAREDGASNFAANNKWAFFPSAALKWTASNESFMRPVRWINDLAFRVSAGAVGNSAISPYRSHAALSTTTSSSYLFGGSQPASYYPGRPDSPDLTWERTTMYNAAVDMSVLRRRLTFTFEAYTSRTKDLLLNVQTASQSGYTTRLVNLGETSNKGVELSIESRNIVKKKFNWTSSLTLSHNKQEVLDIGNEDFVTAFTSAGNNPYMMYGYKVGYPLNALWGFRYGGTWKSVDEFKRNDVTKAYTSASIIQTDDASRQRALGTARYYDVNRDGTLGQEDLVYLGTADPWLYGGLQNNFSYGPFKLGVYMTYSLGGKIYNYSELYMSGSYMSNQYRYMLDSWHPVRNPDSDWPRAGAFDTDVPSDRQVHDATYFRLKNVSLSYTWDLSRKSKLIRDVTFTATGENLWLWKNYNGFDPDVSSSEESALRRVDLGAYPKPRTFVFSIQVRY